MHQNSKPLLTGKSLNSLGALNRVQASQFKRQRLDGSHKSREEYVRTPKLSDREQRLSQQAITWAGRPAVGGGRVQMVCPVRMQKVEFVVEG